MTRVDPVCAVTILLLSTGLPSFCESTPELLRRMDGAARLFTSATANIRVTAHTAAIDYDDTESGTLIIKRRGPNKLEFLISYVGRNAVSVALRDSTVEVYTPKNNTIQPYDLRKYRDIVQQLMLLGFGMSGSELASKYEIRNLGSEAIEGQDSTHLDLVPKSPEVLKQLERVEIWISAASICPLRQKFYLGGGDYRLVTYSGVRINPKVSWRALDLPKKAKREPVQ
jgi:outer membrane lipoprotein-sorting protein